MDDLEQFLECVDTPGERVRVCRMRAGFSQQNKFSHAHEIPPSLLSMVERGKRELSDELLLHLAKIFEVSPRFLMTGHEAPRWWTVKELGEILSRIIYLEKRKPAPRMLTSNELRASFLTAPMEQMHSREFENLTPLYIAAPPQLRDLIRFLLSQDTSHLTQEDWDSISNFLVKEL